MTETKTSMRPGKFQTSVRRSRTGLGLFAEEVIPKGACILEYFGRVISKEEELASRSRYLFEVGPRKTIDGATRANTARYINHSCRPNCEPEITRGRVYIMSKRKIKPGEELAYNYGKAYFDQYFKEGGCLCPKCSPPAGAKKTAKKAAPKAAKTAKALKQPKAASKKKASEKAR